jgi:hypothetical protein
MGKSKKKNLRCGADKPYSNLADQIVGDRIVSKKNKEPKIRLRQDESEEVLFQNILGSYRIIIKMWVILWYRLLVLNYPGGYWIKLENKNKK